MDLSNHVIVPREDFLEMQTNAWSQPATSVKDRVGSTLQTTTTLAGVAGVIVLGAWGWAKVVDWREERALQRRMREKRTIGTDTHPAS